MNCLTTLPYVDRARLGAMGICVSGGYAVNAAVNERRIKAVVTMPLAPIRKEDAPDQDLLEAWEYYHTPCAQHLTAPGFAPSRSLTQLIHV